MKTVNIWELGLGAVLGCAVAALAPGPIRAETFIVTVGARAGVSPPYEGADHDIFALNPTFNVRRANTPYRFTPPDGGSTFALIANRYIDLGPMVRFRYSRDGTSKLAGFDRIGFAAEPGVFFDLWPTNWLRGRVEARRGVTGHAGIVGDAGLDLIHTGRKWDFSIGPRVGYGDSRYMDTYFGVTPQEAARSPRIKTAYEPGAGLRYAGVETAVSYHVTNRLRTKFDIGYHRLVNRVANSPVVQLAGSRDQLSASAGVTYSFGIGIGRKRPSAN